jgi:hypothetical protein
MAHTSTRERTRSVGSDIGEDDGVDSGYLQDRKNRIIDEVRRYAYETFNELHAFSRAETDELVQSAENMRLDAQEIAGWERFVDQGIDRQRESAHKLYHEEFMDTMLRAYNETPRIISLQSIGEWDERFKRENVHYMQRKEFIHNKLPTYIENWRRVAKRRGELLKNPACKKLSAADIPDIDKFFDEETFLNLHYNERSGLCAMVQAALSAGGSRMQEFYGKAKDMLQRAANDGVIAKGKVGTWLERIFESKADPALIEAFVSGKGDLPLATLIGRWRKVAEDFDTLQKRVDKEGKPPSFSFITKKKFLDMHYESRLAYLREAEHRMKDREIAGVPPLLLDIRRELDAKDWDSAEHLIGQVRRKELSAFDLQKLQSMEQFLRTQRKEQGVKSNTEHGDPHAELRSLIGELPAVVQPLFTKTAQRGEGAMRCLKSLWYNREWCRQHGHLSDEREELLRQRSRSDTERVVKQGHGKGYENNTLEYGTPAVRQYRGVWAPQILHFNSGGEAPLLEMMVREQHNHAFKYWTTLVPQSVDFATHSYVLHGLFPRIMRCVRRIEESQREGKKAG